MPKKSSPFRPTPSETEVCSFNDGLAKIRARLIELLEHQNNAVFAVGGTSPQGYRDFLANAVSIDFNDRGIPAAVCAAPDDLESATRQLAVIRKHLDSHRSLYVLKAWDPPHGLRSYRDKDIRLVYDKALALRAKQLNLPLEKVDIWAAVYEPGKPTFDERSGQGYDPFEDFVIV